MTAATAERTTTKAAIGNLSATTAAGDLAGALRAALRYLALRRPAVPVMGGVTLTGSRGVLTLSGFDYSTAYSQDIAAPGARGGRTGAILVEATRLLERVAVFGKRDDLHLSVEGGSLVITGTDDSGVTRYRMPLMPIEDRPTPPALTADGIELSAADRTLLLHTAVCVGTDDVLPILTGIHLRAAARKPITAWATDRYRLGHATLTAKAPKGGIDVLIPAATLVKALSSLARIPGPVTLHVDTATGTSPGTRALTDTWVSIRTGSQRISTRTLDGDYPKVDKVVHPDDEPSLTITAPADTLRAAVRRAGAGIDRNSPIRVLVDTRTRAVSLIGGYSQDYTAEVEVAAKVTGKPTSLKAAEARMDGLGLNPRYLADALGAFPGQDVTVEVRGQHKPLVLASTEQPGYRHILMPVRLAG